MRTIVFSPITFNLAETTRAITIARAIADDFHCHFVSYGGAFESFIEEAGFPLTKLKPRVTPQVVRRVYALDQGRGINAPYSTDVVRQMVLGELSLYRSLKPAAVVTGINPTNCISCPVAGIPLVWLIQSGMLMNSAARQGELKNMDALDAIPIRWLPDCFRVKLSECFLDIAYKISAKPFNRIAFEYGVNPLHHMEELFWSGGHLLTAEPPGFSNIDFPPNNHFIGPLIAHLDVPLPDEILNLPRDRTIVYFAMGSSGRADIVARIIAGFAGKPYRVIAPVKGLLNKESIPFPDNVLVTGWLPAYKVNPLADISVIHGGIGTIMTACLAGKPVVGVAMSPEQLLNLENLVKKGFAIRIPKNNLTDDRLIDSIEQLLADPVAQEKAREYQKVIEAWDTTQHVRNFFCETFG